MASKKDMYKTAFGVLAVLLVGYGVYSYTTTPSAGVSEGVQTLKLQETKSSLTVTAYDIEGTVEDDKVGGDFTVLDQNGKNLKTSTGEADGVLEVSADTGLLVEGDRVTVTFKNNSDDGSYLAQATIDLKAGGNPVDLPVHKVGDISWSFSATTLAVAANQRKNVEVDLDTDNSEEYFYKPVLAFADGSSSTQVYATGEITDMDVSGATEVACDTEVLSGYFHCLQINQEWVSSHNIIDDAKIYFESGSTDAAGTVTLRIVDGVPGAPAGTVNINDADAYDTDTTTQTITIT